MNSMRNIIEKAWDDRSLLAKNETRDAIREVVRLLDRGEVRIAEKVDGQWVVNEWLKKAVIMFFPINDMEVSKSGIFEYYDKIPLKSGFEQAGVRVVPPAMATDGISNGSPALNRCVTVLSSRVERC